MLGDAGTCSPGKNDKNGASWSILSVPKYVIMNLKMNNFKDNKSTTTTKIFAIILSNINLYEHVITKVNILIFYKGCLKNFFKKSNEMEASTLR